MAQAVIGGCTYQVAPFKLRELRLAAPYIDRISAAARSGASDGGLAAMSDVAFEMLAVLAVGIDGATPETLEAQASLEELAALRTTFDQILEEAGLKRVGEGRPAAAPAHSPSPSGSTTS